MDVRINLAHHKMPGDPAEVIYTKPSAMPIITEGKLTPQTLYDWKQAADTYITEKDIDKFDQVAKVKRGFQGLRIKNWIQSTGAIVNGMDFEDFYVLLCNAMLEPGWDTRVHNQLHSTRQNGREFNDYYFNILAQNALLDGTELALSMAEICMVIEANLDEDLRKEAYQPSVVNIPCDDTAQWIVRMCELDTALRRQWENTQAMIAREH